MLATPLALMMKDRMDLGEMPTFGRQYSNMSGGDYQNNDYFNMMVGSSNKLAQLANKRDQGLELDRSITNIYQDLQMKTQPSTNILTPVHY